LLVIPAKAGIQRLFFWWLLEQKLPLQAAGNFLLNGKKSPKNVFFSPQGCCSRSDIPDPCANRAHPARDHRRRRLRATGIKLLETLDGTKPRAVRFKSKIPFSLLLLQTHRESTACSDRLQEA
jgi:hypothetical protein